MHIGWMMPHIGDAALPWLLAFGAITAFAAVGLLGQSHWQRLRHAYRGRGPVLLETRGPSRPGPISVSGLKLRLGLIYARGPRRRLRPVTLYAATGRRQADGRIVLDLLHAVCHVQHRPRTFRVDRILTATDAGGAEIHDLSAWVLEAVDA